jgi:hypothetical protein
MKRSATNFKISALPLSLCVAVRTAGSPSHDQPTTTVDASTNDETGKLAHEKKVRITSLAQPGDKLNDH